MCKARKNDKEPWTHMGSVWGITYNAIRAVECKIYTLLVNYHAMLPNIHGNDLWIIKKSLRG